MMMRFTTPLKYEPTGALINGRQLYRLTSDFICELGDLGSGVFITVPAGFETDFASTPKWADDWFGFDPVGPYAKAALIHDWLYKFPAEAARVWLELYQHPLMDEDLRLACDDIFFAAMRALSVSFFVSNTLYLAVRIFGEKHFNRAAALPPKN